MVFENSSHMVFAGHQGRLFAAMGRFPGRIAAGLPVGTRPASLPFHCC
jgi:hypothetical protein